MTRLSLHDVPNPLKFFSKEEPCAAWFESPENDLFVLGGCSLQVAKQLSTFPIAEYRQIFICLTSIDDKAIEGLPYYLPCAFPTRVLAHKSSTPWTYVVTGKKAIHRDLLKMLCYSRNGSNKKIVCLGHNNDIATAKTCYVYDSPSTLNGYKVGPGSCFESLYTFNSAYSECVEGSIMMTVDIYAYHFTIDGRSVIFTNNTTSLDPLMEYLEEGSVLYLDVAADYSVGHMHLKSILPDLRKLQKEGIIIWLMPVDADPDTVAKIVADDPLINVVEPVTK